MHKYNKEIQNISKIAILFAILVLFAIIPAVQAEIPVEQWSKTFGGTGEDIAYSVQQTSDGGYIIAGYTASSGAGYRDAWLIKTDSSGNLVWQKTFGGTEGDEAYSVQQTSDGGYIIAGRTSSSGADDNAWMIKTDNSGNLLWQKTFGGKGPDYANSVQQTSDGGYILAGYTASSGAGGLDAWLIKTDSDGNLAWQKTFGGTEGDEAYSVQQTSDGGYILAGYTASSGAGYMDAWLIKTNRSGNLVWEKTFGGTVDDEALSVQQTSDGGYILAGSTSSSGAGDNDAWLIKTDSDGNLVWQKTFGGTGPDYVYSVQQTLDGGYILAGFTSSSGAGDNDAWLIKTDSDGIQEWSKTFGGTENDLARPVQQTSDGGYIIAGWTASSGAGSFDGWLIKLTVGNPPVADAGPDKTALLGIAVNFDGSNSTADNGISSYSWDFDASDGISSQNTSQKPIYIYTQPGNYTVTLTVTDTAGLKSNDTATVTLSGTPQLNLTKSANPMTYTKSGDVITYTYTVTNEGNVAIEGPITVADDKLGTITISSTGLLPGGVETTTRKYTVKADDVKNKKITNYAVARNGNEGTKKRVYSNRASVTVTLSETPHLNLTKSANPVTYTKSGDVITYSYTVTNDGNVAIEGPITVTDDKLGTITVSSDELTPQATVSTTQTYTTKASDVTNKVITNTATASGTYNKTTVTSNTATATATLSVVPPVGTPKLDITKTASPITYTKSGQLITYTYKVRNSGNVAIKGPITVTDDKLGTFTIYSKDLAPKKTVSKIKKYTTKASDVTNKVITNTATASGTYNGVLVSSSAATVTVKLLSVPPVIKYGIGCDQRFVSVKVLKDGKYDVSNSGVPATYYFKNIKTKKVVAIKKPLAKYYGSNPWFDAMIIPSVPKGSYVTWVELKIDGKNYNIKYNKVISISNSRWHDTKTSAAKYFK